MARRIVIPDGLVQPTNELGSILLDLLDLHGKSGNPDIAHHSEMFGILLRIRDVQNALVQLEHDAETLPESEAAE